MKTELFEKVIEYAENFIYFIIGLILFTSSLFLIYEEVVSFLNVPEAEEQIRWLVDIISKALLLLMIIEVLYTVRVSIKEHLLSAEPFLIVGMIAAIRRILIISVETAYVPGKFDIHMIEIAILGALILIFVISIVMLRKQKMDASVKSEKQ